MVTIHLDPSRLSLEELENVTHVLRGRCAECIERGVPGAAKHADEVRRFLDAVADAIDVARAPRERHTQERALAVDPDSGEWLAGA